MTWQLYSGLLAASIGAFGIATVLRRRTLGAAVLVIVVLGVDAAGFIAFAADPSAAPAGRQSPLLAPAASVGIAILIAWVAWSRLRPSASRSAVRTNDCLACVAALALLVVASAAILVDLEPGYAVAGLVLSAMWFVLWTLPVIRTSRYKRRHYLRASPEAVFELLVDTNRWPSYRDDIEVLRVNPEGPFQNGSEFEARVPVSTSGPRQARRPAVAFVVESVVPPRSFAVRTKDRPRNRYRVDLVPDERGVWMEVCGADYISYARAVFGTMVDVWRDRLVAQGGETPSVRALRRIVESRTTN